MQVSVEKLEGLERKIIVQVPAEDLEQSFQSRLKEAAKTVRINGFRPGKVPASVVKQRYGAAIRQEAIGDIIQNKLAEALVQEKVNPVAMPQVDSIKDEAGQPFEFSAVFEEVPTVEVADLSGLSVERIQAEVVDADLDEMIETLRKQRATSKDVKRKSKKGDTVEIDYEGLKDGEAFEGGTAEKQSLELGSGQMIPGFEKGIIGMKAGEEQTIDVTFPEDYQNEELKGQAVQFNIKVHAVKQSVLPEVDEEFIKAMGVESGDLEAFKTEIRNNMSRELEQRATQQTKEGVIKALTEANEVTVPKAMVAQEIQRLKQDMMRQFGGQLGTEGKMDESMFPDDIFQERAEGSAKAGLLLSQLIGDKKINATPEAVRAYIDKQASAYDTPEEVVNHYYSDDNLLQQVQNLVLENTVVDYILENAKSTNKPLSYQEVMNPSEA